MNDRQSPAITKPKWYKRKWVWAIVVICVLIAIFGDSDTSQPKTDDKKPESSQQAATQSNQKSESSKQNDQKKQEKPQPAKPPRFDEYLNRPMSEVASEFTQQYDPAKSTRIKADKNGYKLLFEDGGKNNPADPTKATPTGLVTTTTIELPELGKCKQGDVYKKLDEAMKLAGLNPNDKGSKNPNIDGTKTGYAAYSNYLGKESIELALQCLYDGDSYELLLKVKPEYR